MNTVMLIWLIGVGFTVGYIDFIYRDKVSAAAAEAGWKGRVIVIIGNILLFLLCVIAWPYLLGVDVKKTMLKEK